MQIAIARCSRDTHGRCSKRGARSPRCCPHTRPPRYCGRGSPRPTRCCPAGYCCQTLRHTQTYGRQIVYRLGPAICPVCQASELCFENRKQARACALGSIVHSSDRVRVRGAGAAGGLHSSRCVAVRVHGGGAGRAPSRDGPVRGREPAACMRASMEEAAWEGSDSDRGGGMGGGAASPRCRLCAGSLSGSDTVCDPQPPCALRGRIELHTFVHAPFYATS